MIEEHSKIDLQSLISLYSFYIHPSSPYAIGVLSRQDKELFHCFVNSFSHFRCDHCTQATRYQKESQFEHSPKSHYNGQGDSNTTFNENPLSPNALVTYPIISTSFFFMETSSLCLKHSILKVLRYSYEQVVTFLVLRTLPQFFLVSRNLSKFRLRVRSLIIRSINTPLRSPQNDWGSFSIEVFIIERYAFISQSLSLFL